MKNKLWNITETIVKRLREAIETDPREAKNFLDEISKEYWFDYLEEELIPEPPKLRPMSELPKEGHEFVFVIKSTGSDKAYNEIGRVHGTVIATDGDVTLFLKAKDYKSKESTHQIIGWLYELPNPNDIKP